MFPGKLRGTIEKEEKLTPEEINAIQDWSNPSDSELHDYEKIGKKDPKIVQKYNALLSACKKLGSFQGKVYRGVNIPIQTLRRFSSNTIVQTKLLQSYTRSRRIAKEFALLGSGDDDTTTGVLWIVQLKHAIDISKYSELPEEEECLLLKGSRLRILKIHMASLLTKSSSENARITQIEAEEV